MEQKLKVEVDTDHRIGVHRSQLQEDSPASHTSYVIYEIILSCQLALTTQVEKSTCYRILRLRGHKKKFAPLCVGFTYQYYLMARAHTLYLGVPDHCHHTDKSST